MIGKVVTMYSACRLIMQKPSGVDALDHALINKLIDLLIHDTDTEWTEDGLSRDFASCTYCHI